MSLVLRYPFNQGSTSLLVTDESGNGSDLTNGGGVTTVNDATYGDVANFGGSTTSDMTLATQPSALFGSANRTVSLWARRTTTTGFGVIYDVGSSTGGNRYTSFFQNTNLFRLQYDADVIDDTGPWPASTWYHIVSTYDGTTVSSYSNGVLLGSKTATLNTGPSGPLTIGNDPDLATGFEFNGYISDFRVYDGALSAIEIADLFSDGPNAAQIDVTMYSHAAHVTWGAVSGASTYKLDTLNSGDIVQTKSSITDLESTVYDLDDGVTYDFNVYTDLDVLIPVYQSVSNSTPTVDTTEADNMLTLISNDLTSIDNGSVSEIDQYLRDNLSTDDKVQARVSFQDSILRDVSLIFVQESESVSIADSPSVLTPFVFGIASNDVTLQLDDLTTELVSFDEVSNTITVEGVTRYVGDTFILDGKKVRVSELN